MSCAIALSIPDALVGVFYDDGIYAALARSLAEGNGYRLQYLPGEPAAVHYPVGYPAFLALLWMIWPSFPDNVALLRGANAVLLGIFAALAVAFLAPRTPLPKWATALAIVAASTAIPMIAVATVLFSEPLFLVLVAPALWAADAAALADRRRSMMLALAAGILAGAATLTRSIGISAIVAIPLSLVLTRRPLPALIAASASLVLIVPWMAWSARHAGATDPATVSNYGTYGQFMAQAGAGWFSLASLYELARPLGAITIPFRQPVLRLVMGLLGLLILAFGVRALWPAARVVVLFMGAYLAVVATWPYGPDRFIWGLLPWLAVAFACGIRNLWPDAGVVRHRGLRRGVVIAGAVILLGGFARMQIAGTLGGGATAAQREISSTFRELLPWIEARTDTSAVIAVSDEALVWLYSGRRAVPSYLWRVRGRSAESFGADTLRAYLERTGATHLIMTGPGSEAAPTIDALMGRYPGYLRIVNAWPGHMLAFEVQRGG